MSPEPEFDARPFYVVFAACFVLLVLVTPVTIVSGGTYTYLDWDLKGSRSQGLVSLGLEEQDDASVEALPARVANWSFARAYEWDRTAEVLDADLLSSHDYRSPDVNAPAGLTVIHSSNMSSFHPPEVCFELGGWRVLASDMVVVDVDPALWKAPDPTFLPIGAFESKRLVLERTNARGVTDVMVTYHVYVKTEVNRVTQEAYWIRASMYVPPGGTLEETDAHVRGFYAEMVPRILELRAAPPPRTVLDVLWDKVATL